MKVEGASEDQEGDKDKNRKVVSFRPTPVFDISQTAGKELPKLPIERLKGRVDTYETIVEAVRHYCNPVTVSFEPIAGLENGFYEKDKRIVVDEAMEPNQRLKTLFHECAHMILGHGGKDAGNKTRRRMETEAEAVSFVVLNSLCPDIGQEAVGLYSFAYLASWGDDEMTDFKAALKDIQDASSKMIAGIEKQLYVMDMKTSQEMAYEHEVAYLHIKRYDDMYICGIKMKEPEDFAVYTVYGQDRIDEAAVQAMKNAGLPAGSLAERNP
ncbi:MAG: ImmA/IrrE family metallo-endopeptidase, partial [Spirochaetales bacterium]|nr:ImmA/IrrE family metallo-endopeptidase [Spirochaetales bacterium]